MKTNALALGVALLLAPAIALESAELPAPAEALAFMDFLAGTWSQATNDGRFVAYYTTPEGGKVISFSELHRGEEVVFHEFEVFDERDGKLVFSPFPGGKPAVPLALAEVGVAERRVAFENPDKDFPTRIEYHRVSEERLVITLSDPHHASDEVQVFDLRRVGE